MLSWLDLTEILLLLLACYVCYGAGKYNGVNTIIGMLLNKNIITEKDLDNLVD